MSISIWMCARCDFEGFKIKSTFTLATMCAGSQANFTFSEQLSSSLYMIWRRVMPPLGCVYFEYRLLGCLPYRCSDLSRKTCSFVRFLTTSHRSPAATFHSQLHSISLISSERFFCFLSLLLFVLFLIHRRHRRRLWMCFITIIIITDA